MKPLIAMITFNRKAETMATINSLAVTGALQEANILIWDNGSQDGTDKALLQAVEFGILSRDNVYLSPENLGCPKALNAIIWSSRLPHQHLIKVDNDVELQTPGWVGKMCAFLDDHAGVALASPWYVEMEGSDRGRIVAEHKGWLEVFPVVGHCVIHRGDFMDQTGYFDVLGPDHLYGFEDLLMCHRAGALGQKCAVVMDMSLRNLQRHNSLDVARGLGADCEGRKEHVVRLRPRYNQLIYTIKDANGHYYVGPEGEQRSNGKSA